MNTYEPHHPNYSHLETITRFHNAVLDATEQYFINQDEGIYNTENVTIIVHGQVFTFDLYPELVDAMTSFAEAEADRYNIDSDSYRTEPAGVLSIGEEPRVEHEFVGLEDLLQVIIGSDEPGVGEHMVDDDLDDNLVDTGGAALHKKYFG